MPLTAGVVDIENAASITGSATPKFRFIREKRRSIWKHKDLEKTGPYSKLLRVADPVIEAHLSTYLNMDG